MAICRKTVLFNTKSPLLLSVHKTDIHRFFCDIGRFSMNNDSRGKCWGGLAVGWMGGWWWAGRVGGYGLWGFWCWALDGTAFDLAEILAYEIHTISRSQIYLGFGHRSWLSLYTPLTFRAERVLSMPAPLCPSVCELYIVHTIRRHIFELESPHLGQTCILGYAQLVVKIGVIDLVLQGYWAILTQNVRKFRLLAW